MIRRRTAAVLPALVFVVLMMGLSASEGAPAQDDPLAIVPVATVADDDILALDGAVAVDVFGVGNRTYAVAAAARDDGIQIVDVTDPAAPVMAGSIMDDASTILDGAYDVAIFGVGGRTYAVVAAVVEDGIQIVDVTDPAAPVMAGSITDGDGTALDGASAVDVFGVGGHTYAVVASYREGIQVVNLTDPSNPAATAAIFDDDHTILLDNTRGVDTFRVGGSTYAVATSRNDDGLEVVNVTDPASPVLVARIRDGGSGTTLLEGARGVDAFVAGGRTYAAVAALDDNGIQVVEIADPSEPAAVSGVVDGPALLLEGAVSVTTLNVGRAVYTLAVSMFESGVQAVDVTDPANPVPVRVRGGDDPAPGGTARDLAVFERGGSVYAVVATGFFENSLRILEVVPDGSLEAHGAVPPPAPVSAAYHPLAGSITVTFDATLGPAVHVDRLHVREAGQGDIGVALSGRPTVEGAVLTVALDAGRAGSIGAMASPRLDVGGGAVQDMYGNPVPAAAGLPLDVPDTVPPVLDSATYHNSTGLLSVSFSEPLNHAATDYPGLAVIGPSGNLTLADAANRATPDSETIAATLDQAQRGMVGPDSILKVSGGAVADESGNRIEPATVPITLTANLPPSVDAGPDRTVTEGDWVALNGTATDPDPGDDLTYLWTHDSTLAINLSNTTAPSTAFTAPEVDADTVVIFTLTADDGRGASSSDTVSVTILAGSPPDPPQNLRFGATTSTTITLTWDDPGDATITGYKVLSRAALTERDLAVLVDNTGSADTTYVVRDLDPDTIYVFRVVALGEHGESDWSNFVRPSTAPANSPPTADAGPDRAVTEGSSVTLSGTAVHTGEQPTYLWTHDRPDLGIALAGPDTLSPSFTAPNVDADTAVTFTLTVTDQHNVTATDTVTITISDVSADDPPAAPQNLWAGSATSTTITLTWDDPGDATITGYKVLSRAALTEPNLAVLVSDTGSADTTHTVTGLNPDTIYVFRVVALGEHGESDWSNFVRPSTLP